MAEEKFHFRRILGKSLQWILASLIVCVVTIALYTGGIYSSITQGRNGLSSLHGPKLPPDWTAREIKGATVDVFGQISIRPLLGDEVLYPGKSFALGNTHVQWNEVITRWPFHEVLSSYQAALTKWGWHLTSDSEADSTGFVVFEKRGRYLMIENVQPGMRFQRGSYHVSLLNPGEGGLLKSLQELQYKPQIEIYSNDGVHAPVEISVQQHTDGPLGGFSEKGFETIQGGSHDNHLGTVRIVESENNLGVVFKDSVRRQAVIMEVPK